jgi:hypothetical protein
VVETARVPPNRATATRHDRNFSDEPLGPDSESEEMSLELQKFDEARMNATSCDIRRAAIQQPESLTFSFILSVLETIHTADAY